MKVVAVFVLLFAVAYASGIQDVVYDTPIYELTRIEDVETDGGLETETELPPIRHRRVTCDLLSFQTVLPSVKSAACAAKCIAQRRKGGRCSGGICHCR